LQYNPKADLAKIKIPVLALNGGSDVQVPPHPNLNIIQESITWNGNAGVVTKEIDGLNHLFQQCKTCTIKEYFQLDETFSTHAIHDIIVWLENKK
jgi:hypothetical protein